MCYKTFKICLLIFFFSQNCHAFRAVSHACCWQWKLKSGYQESNFPLAPMLAEDIKKKFLKGSKNLKILPYEQLEMLRRATKDIMHVKHEIGTNKSKLRGALFKIYSVLDWAAVAISGIDTIDFHRLIVADHLIHKPNGIEVFQNLHGFRILGFDEETQSMMDFSPAYLWNVVKHHGIVVVSTFISDQNKHMIKVGSITFCRDDLLKLAVLAERFIRIMNA
jgi:hypothetical protein